jgi:hypothetical protein
MPREDKGKARGFTPGPQSRRSLDNPSLSWLRQIAANDIDISLKAADAAKEK